MPDCEKVWKTHHGPLVCFLPTNHNGRHAAYCEICLEQDGLGYEPITWTDTEQDVY